MNQIICQCDNLQHPTHLGTACAASATTTQGYCQACYKKLIEFFQLTRFKNAFKGFPDGEIIVGKDNGSEPDFFVGQAGGFLGIELTRLYRTPEAGKRPRQEGESIRDQIVEHARLIHERNGGPLLDVCIMFSSNQDWNKRQVPFLASRIARLVFRQALEIDGNIRLQNPWTSPDYFPYEIEEIWINRYRWLKRSHWSAPDGGYMPDFNAGEIQQTIDKKNSSVSAYRQKGPEELWLLILHGLTFSSMFDSSEALKQTYSSEFDRVFMFDLFCGTCVELDNQAPHTQR